MIIAAKKLSTRGFRFQMSVNRKQRTEWQFHFYDLSSVV
jgi:hypothetical protein